MRTWILITLFLTPLVLADGDKDTKKPVEAPKKEAAVALEEAKPDVDPKVLAKNFKGKDPYGNDVVLWSFKGKWIVLEWFNPGCPYVKKHYNANNMQTLQKELTDKGVIWISIVSSAPGKQGYKTAEQWKEHLKKVGWAGTHLVMDPTGEIGRLYGAKRTPEFWIVDPKLAKVYHGAMDDKPRAFTPADIATAKNYIRMNVTAGLAGKELPIKDNTPYG